MKLIQQQIAAGTALSNSTTMTSLARKVFAADELTQGKVFRVAGSLAVTAQNSTDTLLPTLTFGTSAAPASNTALGAGAAIDAAVSDVSVFELELSVHSATRAVVRIIMSDVDAEGTASISKVYHEVLTIAAGTAYNLDICGTWSVANAGNSARSESFDVYEIA